MARKVRADGHYEEIRVETLGELGDEVFRGALKKNLGHWRSDFVFRGVGDKRWPLETSLMRFNEGHARDKHGHFERRLLLNLKKYAPRGPSAVAVDDDWHWMTLGQHHGLPTRLLDWTFSPLVGLHFVTWEAQHNKADGALWMVNIRDALKRLPRHLHDSYAKAGGFVFDIDGLAKVIPSLETLDQLGDADAAGRRNFTAFFEPPSFDDRIVNQFSCLSALTHRDLAFDDWLKQAGVECRKVIIPAKLKREVRDKLDHSNINDRMLFPGLDGICRWLKGWYAPGRRSPRLRARTRP